MTERDRRIRAIWEAFAVGDAMGMPTEFMTGAEIRAALGGPCQGLTPPERSAHHSDLPMGSVTDDTEQNLYLLALYRRDGGVSVENTVEGLTRWIEETDAVGRRYIGPSSLRALTELQKGADPALAGRGGTTCGGIMRTPSAVLWNPDAAPERWEEDILACLLPTHNTSQALEAAGAYGFALRAALEGGSRADIFAAAEEGAGRLLRRAPYRACAPSSAARIRAARDLNLAEKPLCALLSDVWGTGLPSADVCGAVFALFAHAGADVWLAIRAAASLGGDTDTIAALAGALCAAHAGGHNIPADVVDKVRAVNASLFAEKLETGD